MNFLCSHFRKARKALETFRWVLGAIPRIAMSRLGSPDHAER